jgi:hypothetical protein
MLIRFPLNVNKTPATNGEDWRNFKGEIKSKIYGIVVPDNVIIFDLDEYKGVTTKQIESSLKCKIEWEDALIQKTPRGGNHYAFYVPNSSNMPNSTNLLGIDGFDTRSSGRGYIATGEGYEDVTMLGFEHTLSNPDLLPELPKTVIEALSQDHQSNTLHDDDLLTMVKFAPLDLNLDEVKNYVLRLPAFYAEDRDLWLSVGLAIYRQTEGSKQGWFIFDQFSKQCKEKYDYNKNFTTWKSFKRPYRGNPITFATVISYVKEAESKPDFLIKESEKIKTLDKYEEFKQKVKSIPKDKLSQDTRTIIAQKASLSLKENAGIKISTTEIKKEIKPEKKKKLKPEGDLIIPDWCKDWVFVSKTCEFLNTKSYVTMKREAFNARFDKEKECKEYEISASSLALKNYEIKNVQDFIFNPTKDTFVEKDAEKYFNTYRKMGIEAKESLDEKDLEVIKLFLNHLDFLFEKEEEKKILLNWFAHTIQNPGDRINWALLIQGCQGCGKSYLVDVLREILGKNVSCLDPTAVFENFTGWAYGSLVIAIEEIRISGTNKFQALDKLKPFISNNEINIQEKGRDRRTVENFTNYLMLTNHKDAIPISEDERRYCILFSKQKSQEKMYSELGGKEGHSKYFKNLFETTKKESNVLARFFLDYKIDKDFDHKGIAPNTESRKIMIRHSISPERNKIEDLISELECEVVNEKFIDITWFNKLSEMENEYIPKTRTLAAILLEMGYEQIDKRFIKISKTRKNHSVWYKPEKITEEEAKEKVKQYHNEVNCGTIDEDVIY